MARKNGRKEVPSQEIEEQETLFLGTLRSEFDTAEELAEGWSALATAAEAVKLAYLRRDLTPEQTAEALAQLRLLDTNGSEWTVGATTGEWYRKNPGGTQWMKAPPPSVVMPDLMGAPRWIFEGAAVLMPREAPLAVEPTASMPEAFLPAKSNDGPNGFDDPDALEDFFNKEAAPEPDFVPEVTGPAPRANAVSISDVLGWQPVKRIDGPELAEIEPSETVPEMEEVPETKFGYGDLLENFKQEHEERADWAAPPVESSYDDYLDLPEDRFYRPDDES